MAEPQAYRKLTVATECKITNTRTELVTENRTVLTEVVEFAAALLTKPQENRSGSQNRIETVDWRTRETRAPNLASKPQAKRRATAG